ncbi:MAG: hypothetical protein IJ573_00865 [Clostridia bacterium]|nr:hypothetical protein [Clostridia bacterium]
MYIIYEIQTNADGAIGTLTFTAQTWLEAQSIYHAKLSAAAASELPCHAVILMDASGTPMEHQAYRHTQPDPEG